MTDLLESGRHFAGLNTRLVVGTVRDMLGDTGVRALLDGAEEDRPLEVLLDDTSWSTYAQFRRLLEVAVSLLEPVGGFDGLTNPQHIVRATSPDVVANHHAQGSPAELLMGSGDIAAAVYPIVSIRPELPAPTHARLACRMADGFEPFPELCAFFAAIFPMSVQLFGLGSAEVTELSCQCRGDDECVFDVKWDESGDLSSQLQLAQMTSLIAEARLETFQNTVHDIVSSDDLDTVLGRIVRSAARAMQAVGFVLEIDALPGGPRLYVEGLTPEAAPALLAEGAAALSVDVVSAHRRYGRLLVGDRTGITSSERNGLEAYARLAATALDSAFALEEARRQAQTATTLLGLSTSLAELSTAGDVAAKVVTAMPDVIDCDCAAVLVVTDDVARVVAHHGFTNEEAAILQTLEIPIDRSKQQPVMRRTVESAQGFTPERMTALGLVAVASAPFVVDDDLAGLLVAGVRSGAERVMEDERLAERFGGLAGQAAVALRNGRLLDAIRHQSLHDSLTDLPNRALILDRVEQMLVRSRRQQAACAALFIDLDGFKEINDTLGHGAGDEFLQMVSARLRTAVRASDTVGRLGGDEFIVLADGSSLDAGVEVVAERLLDVLREPFRLAGRERPVSASASIGIAMGDRTSAGELLRDADIALYSAKAAGKACYRIFAPEMHTEVRSRAALTDDLSQALVNEELFLVYQPILNLETEVVTGSEALLRWNHPNGGVTSPADFIPLLEESGLIVEVGRWVLHEACRQTAEWHATGHLLDVSVNASVRQLERRDFVDDVRSALKESGLPSSHLIVEITETAIMRDAEATIEVLTGLKELGVRIAIDDFGTGYSSLAYLRQFPVDAIKIDRSFIDGVADSAAARELVHTLVRLGKALNLETFAEGIEHRFQLDRLQDEGCDSGQGFMFARPLPPDVFLQLLGQRERAWDQLAVSSPAHR